MEGTRWRRLGWLTVLLILGVIGGDEGRREHRQRITGPRYQSSAIGTLKAIADAQTLFREGDRDENGTLDYAPSLEVLARYDLIRPELADGLDGGYRFEVQRSPTSPEFVWFATGSPDTPPGRGYVGLNMAGLTFFNRNGPVTFDADGSSQDPVL
ncbi:MAG: hypothetical protein JKY65_00230 [Planctomycetes bacterium]|nr:hypothetical protein [Planctomycetota bacterium]